MTAEHSSFDLDYDGQGLTRPIRRPLGHLEKEWINAILQTNKDWADVTIGEVFVDRACTCGCRTVHLERPPQPQNSATAHRFHEMIGMMWIFTERGKSIGISLHAKNGSIGELEVVYQENEEPWPPAWREVSRRFLSDILAASAKHQKN